MRSPRRRQRAREELPRVRKARAEVAAYASCTESQMMTMFGWTDPKMPAQYIAQANREKLGNRWYGEDRRIRPEAVTR